MGRVHKKKIAEYAESAENENEQDEETKKSATVESNSDESEAEDGVEEVDDGKKKQSVVRDQTRPEGNTDDEFHSVQGGGTDDDQEDGSSGTGGKKGNKRKAAPEKLADEDNDNLEDSDDEPLNGGGAGAGGAKKGRKSAGGGKQKAPGKNGKAVGRRAKGKKGKAKSQAVDEGNEEEGEEVYEVKDIVGHKVEHGVTFYLIRWKGYTKDDDTWEPEDTLSCPNIIEKYKNKQSPIKSSKKSTVSVKKGRKGGLTADPNKEWEVDKIIDYAEEKNQRIFRIRWKGFGPKHDTWEPEENLSCDEIIDKFMKRMKSQEGVSFKELREEPKKTKRLVNETAPRTNYHNPIGRKSKRAVSRKRVYYGDSDE